MGRLKYFLFLFLSFNAFAGQGHLIYGSANVKGSGMDAHSEYQCRKDAYDRRIDAFIALKRSSEKKCNNGHKVNWGPICNSIRGIYVRSRYLNKLECSITCLALITCYKEPLLSKKNINRKIPIGLDYLRNTPINPHRPYKIIDEGVW